jgi:hypothetical protein
MYVVNPKNTELAVFKKKVGQRIGNIRVMGYVTTTAQTVELFKTFVAEMKQRQQRLEEAGLRQLTVPTEDMPARFVVVDEMNELKDAYKATDSPMVTAISQGRTSLDWVIASVQIAKVAVLGEVRDQFPLRICFRTATPENTKAGLTIGEVDGPACSRIPRSTPGVGWYVREDGDLRKFRTAHVTDGQLDDLAEGKLPTGMLTAAKVKYEGPPCFVYLAPERKSQKVGYVGIAGGNALERHPVARRRAQHRKYDLTWCAEHERVENFWTAHLDDTRMTVYKYPSRSAALIAEERLIKELRPKWNIVHKGAHGSRSAPVSSEALPRRSTDPAAGRRHRILRPRQRPDGRQVLHPEADSDATRHLDRVPYRICGPGAVQAAADGTVRHQYPGRVVHPRLLVRRHGCRDGWQACSRAGDRTCRLPRISEPLPGASASPAGCRALRP